VVRVPQNRSWAIRPLCGFASPHLGQESMRCIALLPAPNINYLERYVQVNMN